ncbi:polysaccharide deacetylase family protein [Pseudoalteromonas sp. T1lg65]|uniref:polysaccharide deacetylase family protein n=1 Tax=Pseudoalteromonas sp. T1lg65 TaxID=2077101 RepID=UPI003F797BB7
MKLRLSILAITLLIAGCGDGNEITQPPPAVGGTSQSGGEQGGNGSTTSGDNNTQLSSTQAIEKIVNAQGMEHATELDLSVFSKAEFSCIKDNNLEAVKGYLINTQDKLNHKELQTRLCKVAELYALGSKQRLTFSLLKEVGIKGLSGSDGKVNDWAMDELMLGAPEQAFEWAKLQKLVDDFHYNQANIWPKQINISFDDGGALESIYQHLPLFDKYNATFTYYVSHYFLIDSEKVAEIAAHGHEIGHHGTTHKHAKDYVEKNGLQKWLEDDIFDSLSAMKSDGLDVTSYAYPYGAYTRETDTELKKHFSHIRKFASWASVNYRGERSDRPITTGLSIDAHRFNLDKIRHAIDTLKGGETLYLATHVIGKTPNEWYITPENLEAVLKYAAEKGLKFCHTNECMNFKSK